MLTFLFVLLGLATGTCIAEEAQIPFVLPPNAPREEKSLCELGAPTRKALRAEDKITAGLLIYKVNPSYPKSARKARIEGTVILCADISKEGEIQNLRAASGPPELIPSSIEAVSRWRYKPYLLNGEPVAVSTEIKVNYALQH